jgi:HD-like signal output (HDOD) protein
MDLIERIVKNAKDLPTLPTVYSALCDLIASPKASVRDVADLISTDQASASRLLRIANSSFFGLRGKVETISRAVALLGFNEVSNLILSSSVMNLFEKRKPLLGFRPRNFWAHSIGVGLITRWVGQSAGMTQLENFFLAGILHDIGKLYFFEYAEEEYVPVLTLVKGGKHLIRDAELEVLGVDHSLMGSFLADEWKLPQPIQNAITYHHFGKVGDKADILVAAVHLADVLARALELGYPGDNLIPQPAEVIWPVLRLRPGMIEKMVPKILKDYEDAMNKMFLK